MILLLGNVADAHVRVVAAALAGAGAETIVLDPFDAGSAGVTVDGPAARLVLAAGTVPVERIASVWWRLKPPFVIAGESVNAFYDQQFGVREWAAAIDHLAAVLPDRQVNARAAAVRAGDKLRQLDLARAAGFTVPATLVANAPTVIADFIRACPQGCVHKTLTPYMRPDGFLKYATLITAEQVEARAAMVAVCPGIYQAFVRPDHELRVTVVGDTLFGARIRRPDPDTPDWRREIMADVYDRYEPDPLLRDRLLDLHRRLGLVYAAYDFVVGADGDPVFLECNPNGQWLWLEERLDLPISDAVARALR